MCSNFEIKAEIPRNIQYFLYFGRNAGSGAVSRPQGAAATYSFVPTFKRIFDSVGFLGFCSFICAVMLSALSAETRASAAFFTLSGAAGCTQTWTPDIP